MLRKGGMMRSVMTMLYFAHPWHCFTQSWVLLASAARIGCWLRFSLAGLPGLVPHPTLQFQELGPSRGQDLDFVPIECRMRLVPAEPVLPTALPSSVCIPSLRFSRPKEGARVSGPDSESKILKVAAAGFWD